MKIAFVTSELFPYSKSGGLADVSAALPQALARLGHEVRVFTPLYAGTKKHLMDVLGELPESRKLREFLWIGDHQREVSFCETQAGGVELTFVADAWAFDRPGLYLDARGKDYPDNAGRFALLCRAVLEYYAQSGYAPHVFHCNDWQTALLPVYLKEQFAARLPDAKSVLTIHNLGYQGLFPAEEIYSTGLGWEPFTLDKLEFHGQLSLLKGGIVYADALTTVSPSYAAEIQTTGHGMGLAGLLRHHRPKLRGILNGIDTQTWDPSRDPFVPANYSAKSIKGKAGCKRALQAELGLAPDPKAFLLGMITRLDQQKGVGLVLDAFPKLAKESIQLALLGAGDPGLEARAAELSMAYRGQAGVRLGYDEQLAHLIYAGADALLMPSKYEPCGLNQMYAQRYGTVPIVRATGGLKDTVVRYTPARLGKGQASGFSFGDFTAAALSVEIRRAQKLYSEDRASWKSLVKDSMKLDHSWDGSAAEYAALYSALAKGEATPPRAARGPQHKKPAKSRRQNRVQGAQG